MSRKTNLAFLKKLVSEKGNEEQLGQKLGNSSSYFQKLLNAKRLPSDEEFSLMLKEFESVGDIEKQLKSWKKSVAMSLTAARKRGNKKRQLKRTQAKETQAAEGSRARDLEIIADLPISDGLKAHLLLSATHYHKKR